MNRRSRKGCIDCKRSKIKCDEIRPSCGTCLRRGYECQGYLEVKSISSRMNLKSNAIQDREGSRIGRSRYKHHKTAEQLSSTQVEEGDNRRDASGSDSDTGSRSPRMTKSKIEDVGTYSAPAAKPNICTLMNMERSRHIPLFARIPSIPRGTIRSADEPVIEIYFVRHPSELVISSEFVDEMNSNVLQVFHEDPEGVCDSLSAIGHIYLDSGRQALVPVLDRKARILARLRVRTGLEQMLVLLLGLCALELIDERSLPADSVLPTLIANAAIIIKHHQDTGNAIGSVARYFIQALARQDMMISLARSHRPLIPCSAWLEDDYHQHADRFMGFTGSLMPLLAELGSLAEALRNQESVATLESTSELEFKTKEMIIHSNIERDTLFQRAMDLRARIEQWHPLTAQKVSFQSSRNLLFHAQAHKTAATLYLHRLLSPPGSSSIADQTALSIAHEVLMYISSMSDQLKTVLWPVLVAGSEVIDKDDRRIVLHMFDDIYRQRMTVTARRTKNFCVNRVWAARDSGVDWNWLDLAYQFPGECLPI